MSCSQGSAGITNPDVHTMVERFATVNGLSGQETAVLLLAAKGVHRKEAASQLGCSTGTVDTYWRRIFKKTLRTSQCEVLAALLAFALAASPPGEWLES